MMNLGVNSVLFSILGHKEKKRKYKIYVVMEGVKFLIT